MVVPTRMEPLSGSLAQVKEDIDQGGENKGNFFA